MAHVADIFGILGVIGIIIAYFLLSIDRMQANHWSYSLINFIGALFIVWSLLDEWNLSAFLMEAAWAVISLYGLVKSLIKRPTA